MTFYQSFDLIEFEKELLNQNYENAQSMITDMRKKGVPQALINYYAESVVSDLIHAKKNIKEARKLVKIVDSDGELSWRSWAN